MSVCKGCSVSGCTIFFLPDHRPFPFWIEKCAFFPPQLLPYTKSFLTCYSEASLKLQPKLHQTGCVAAIFLHLFQNRKVFIVQSYVWLPGNESHCVEWWLFSDSMLGLQPQNTWIVHSHNNLLLRTVILVDLQVTWKQWLRWLNKPGGMWGGSTLNF